MAGLYPITRFSYPVLEPDYDTHLKRLETSNENDKTMGPYRNRDGDGVRRKCGDGAGEDWGHVVYDGTGGLARHSREEHDCAAA
ncbi:hypothetical protein BCAR13_60087 [Paraburkholderia caribensis]|nr:hypothetical protein BCAR13_60087 [Paraburkholderia caribensis]